MMDGLFKPLAENIFILSSTNKRDSIFPQLQVYKVDTTLTLLKGTLNINATILT